MHISGSEGKAVALMQTLLLDSLMNLPSKAKETCKTFDHDIAKFWNILKNCSLKGQLLDSMRVISSNNKSVVRQPLFFSSI